MKVWLVDAGGGGVEEMGVDVDVGGVGVVKEGIGSGAIGTW